jgi:hypothetical protein
VRVSRCHSRIRDRDIPVLKNAKHELFAQAPAKGMPAIRAYEEAGYKPDRGAACRLSANVSVRARLSELLEKAAERTLVTIKSVTEELEKARQLALQTKSASAAIAASMGKGKLHKLFEERGRTLAKEGLAELFGGRAFRPKAADD